MQYHKHCVKVVRIHLCVTIFFANNFKILWNGKCINKFFNCKISSTWCNFDTKVISVDGIDKIFKLPIEINKCYENRRGKLDIIKLLAAGGHKKLIGKLIGNHNICSVLKKRESIS